MFQKLALASTLGLRYLRKKNVSICNSLATIDNQISQPDKIINFPKYHQKNLIGTYGDCYAPLLILLITEKKLWSSVLATIKTWKDMIQSQHSYVNDIWNSLSCVEFCRFLSEVWSWLLTRVICFDYSQCDSTQVSA